MRHTLSNHLTAWWTTHLQAHWQGLSVREQILLRLLGGLLMLTLAVSVLVLPTWHTWQQGRVQSAALSQQLAQMRALQAQARQLQQQQHPSAPTNALPTLQKLATANGWTAQAQGARVLVQIKAATPTALAQWLAQAREQAQALPAEAHLQRSPGNEPRWDGSLLLRLPDGTPNGLPDRPRNPPPGPRP